MPATPEIMITCGCTAAPITPATRPKFAVRPSLNPYTTLRRNPPEPVLCNWGLFGNAEFDGLIATARTSFADADRDAGLARLHARIVEEAPFLWVAHDVGPRAMSAKVKGVVQPKSWFIDIAPMSME